MPRNKDSTEFMRSVVNIQNYARIETFFMHEVSELWENHFEEQNELH